MKTTLYWARRLLWLVPVLQAYGAVPFYDGFDASPAYGPGTNFLAPINEWRSDSTDVQVTTNLYDTAPNAVQLVGPAVLSNTVAGATGAVGQIWTEFRACPYFGSAPDLASHGMASMAAYFATNHFFSYATTGGWVTCSNTIWGGAVPALPDGQFVRLTFFQDYARSNSAVFVNSNLVAQDIRFYGNSAAYRAFMAQGGDDNTTSHLDTVSYSNGPPADILTDANNDGNHDVDELALYGYAMRYLVVATNAAYTNLQLAVDVARGRDVIVVSNGTYAGDVTINHAVGSITGGVFTIGGTLSITGTGLSVTSVVGITCGNVSIATGNALVVNGQVISSNLTVSGGLGLAAGGAITCTNFTIDTNVTVNLSNATVTVTHLAINSGGQLVVSNGTLTADGIVLSGSFTVGSTWGNAQAQSAMPLYDGFEPYAVGAPLANYAFNGWGASAPTVLVETQTVAAGAKAVAVAGGESVSNRINGAGLEKVWTDLRVRPTLGTQPDGMPTNTSTCLLYFNSSGYAVVYSLSNGWMTCSSNAHGAAVTNLASESKFMRLTAFLDFSLRQSAVFLDGELLRQQVPFAAGAPTSYTRFGADNQGTGTGFVDEVSVRATPPTDLYGDVDHDGVNDVLEIDRFGNLSGRPPGSMFTFR